MTETNYARAVDFEDRVVYYPQKRPGYTAWVRLCAFGDGDLGLTFLEVRREPNPRLIPASLEFVESRTLPYQYSQTYLPAAHPDLLHEAVYLKSTDAGRS